MSFEDAAAYDRFMGRFSEPLAEGFVDLLAPAAGARALDVGCGPGALTARLAERLGPGAVTAVDPSGPFVEAVAARVPGVTARRGNAEELPFADDSFDLAAAQLVVHFMRDPVAGLTQMARVTRAAGMVAACVWDHGGESGPLTMFWRAARSLDPTTPGEARLPGTHSGHLEELALAAGWTHVEPSTLTVRVAFASFDDWWAPFELGVGPAGAHVAALDAGRVRELRAACRGLLPSGGFEVAASAWAVRGAAP